MTIMVSPESESVDETAVEPQRFEIDQATLDFLRRAISRNQHFSLIVAEDTDPLD